MAGNRPRGREKNITGAGKSVHRRGGGLGNGSVGTSGGYTGRPSGARRPTQNVSEGSSHSGGNVTRSGGGGMMKFIIIALVLLLGGGGGVGSLLSSNSTDMLPQQQTIQQSGNQSGSSYIDLSSLCGNLGGGNVSSGWEIGNNTGNLDTSVAAGSREKYTEIYGNGQDKATIMVYLCGTDLESRSKMATSDLQEMIDATISEDVNLIVYSGGCRQWQNRAISSQTNQIWQVKDDGIKCLENNLGSYSMTDPDTLSFFIRWCAKNFPANRNSLIFWDHGGGSVSGYGYDEKFASSGGMSLGEIDQALTEANVKFDFIGFDACLMATTENALMLSKHADYMIASEETEPGIGWYYTNWLSNYSKDTSCSTLEIGKNIIDDFVDTCASKLRGQSTTLSIVDLAELENTLPDTLTAFSTDTYHLIKEQDYAKVSKARSGAREFGTSSKIDQVDLVHLAKNMETGEGDALAEAILGAVKYNRTSSNMTNSHGLSIYFPLRKASLVDSAVQTYNAIGLDSEYSRCIQAFASMEVSGQAMSGGTSSPVPTLMDLLGGNTATSMSSDIASQLLGAFLGGNVQSISGLTSSNIGFLDGRVLSDEEMIEYYADNSFDNTYLKWNKTDAGDVVTLPEEQWEVVQTLYANMFYDDGAGFIDLGLDNVYEFDENGSLVAPKEATWIAINNQPVAYYHEATVDDGTNYHITGRVPVLYNGERAELVIEFSDRNPYGSVVGVRRVYTEGETETIAKTMDPITDGDVIDFVCDYYSYEGEYLDSYMLGEQMIVEGELMIGDVYVDEDAANLTYMFTDIYHQNYWTTPVEFE
ncbi:MAG: peptidase C11 [Lachnospiraceae bacterium]|nr:peptidase C11 [Lachnospiraceae bacterium]